MRIKNEVKKGAILQEVHHKHAHSSPEKYEYLVKYVREVHAIPARLREHLRYQAGVRATMAELKKKGL